MVETSVSLLDRLRSRPDAASWQRLVDLYAPLLRGWLRRQGLQSSDVDDLAQDVLAVLVRELPHFEHRGPGAFRSWLRAITANRLLNFWRARLSRPEAAGGSDLGGVLEQLQDPRSELNRLWDREHDQYVVRRALALIEQEFAASTWRAFRRVMVDGAAVGAVAAELGLSANAIFIAKSRVLSRVRQVIRGLVD